jgi:pilus assembly protein Flp/PilA
MFMQRIVRSRKEEDGASAVEYGLLVAAIAAIIVLIVFVLGKFVKEGFSDTCSAFASQSTFSTSGSCS